MNLESLTLVLSIICLGLSLVFYVWRFVAVRKVKCKLPPETRWRRRLPTSKLPDYSKSDHADRRSGGHYHFSRRQGNLYRTRTIFQYVRICGGFFLGRYRNGVILLVAL